MTTNVSSSSSSSSGGIGFLGLLQVAFIVLKVIGFLNWSWIWVFSPFWIGIPAVILLYIVIFGGYLWLMSR